MGGTQSMTLFIILLVQCLPLAQSHACAAAFQGHSCEQAKQIPCFGKAFLGPLTVTRANVPASLSNIAAILGRGSGKQGMSKQEAVSKLPPFSFWGKREDPRKQPYVTCALVGNSPILSNQAHGKLWGAEIDQHQLIMRLNNAPTKGHEKYVGRRTNLRYQNERFEGYREWPSDVLLGRYCHNFKKLSPSSNEAGSSFKHSCLDPKSDFPDVLAKMLRKKIHPLNNEFDKQMASGFRQKGFDPSSGMRALGILLHVCRHVDMYGFRGVEGFRAWYWDKYPGYKGKPPQDVIDKKFPRLSRVVWNVEEWISPQPKFMQTMQKQADEMAADFKDGRISPSSTAETKRNSSSYREQPKRFDTRKTVHKEDNVPNPYVQENSNAHSLSQMPAAAETDHESVSKPSARKPVRAPPLKADEKQTNPLRAYIQSHVQRRFPGRRLLAVKKKAPASRSRQINKQTADIPTHNGKLESECFASLEKSGFVTMHY
mmetsp:Transcript_4584/g.8636  ORF Transcript_4584/g.8636 Transcript_4584/m.8636 type:complete len:485 (-) Transcript_4584:144-1598(-)